MVVDVAWPLQAAGLVLIGLCSALAALGVLSLCARRTKPRALAAEVTFLFAGADLVDASPAARRLFETTEPQGSDLHRLARFLAPRFPGAPDRICAGPGAPPLRAESDDGAAVLLVETAGRRLKVSLAPAAPAGDVGDGGSDDGDGDRGALQAVVGPLAQEMAILRHTAGSLPFPVWRQTAAGRIAWSNAAHRRLERLVAPDAVDTLWPQQVFSVDAAANHAAGRVSRVKLEPPGGGGPTWYECQIAECGADFIVAAVPVDRVVQAERSLHDFVQTLTQTFAHLNVGLAIFSRERELALFNPALSDLLELPPDFLIRRPTLFQVFDRLREQRLMPEPKNYKSWCQHMSDLEAAATDGAYSETWSLVDGRTYRVTGRPHHEGTIAFVFEDISAEISLKLEFRSELQLKRAVFDGLDEAIGVFAPAGELTMANAAFDRMWFGEARPADAPPVSFIEMSRRWQEASAPTPVWGDARDFAATISERSNWHAEVRLLNGTRLACRFDALPGGATLVGFAEVAEPPQAPRLVEGARATA